MCTYWITVAWHLVQKVSLELEDVFEDFKL